MSRSTPLLLATIVFLAACAGPASTVSTGLPPAGNRQAAAAAQAAVPLLLKPDSATADWHRLDADQTGMIGVGSDRALRELLGNRRAQPVVVAVVDGGVDTLHRYLAPNLWINSKEVAGNGKDDDGNGFVDDTRGWNFPVTSSGAAVDHDTFELTRLYAACHGQPAGGSLTAPDAATCNSLAGEYQKKVSEIKGTLTQITSIDGMYQQVTAELRTALGGDSITRAKVEALRPGNERQSQARAVYLQLAENGIDGEMLADAKKAYESQATWGLDTMYNPHAGSGSVGSRDVMGPDAMHGTHVSGIIAAVRDAANPVQGIATSVRIMAVRAVPDGDERDGDIARAIRYAADQGARIINMSFGKPYSPGKASVDSAMMYAAGKGVLLVHAAGNDAEDNDSIPAYPSRTTLDGAQIPTWLEVGASSWKGPDKLAASFSNYGKKTVDLFAPGEDILSTVPGGDVKRESGTSMAAPVVSGVAALIMSYFPSLTASEVRDILLQSVRHFPGQLVEKPGAQGEKIPFGDLSASGGVVDAYAAVKLALEKTR